MTKRLSSSKSLKKRMTVVVARDADGFFKLPLVFIKESCRSRHFGGKASAELEVEYVRLVKGWMNSELFQRLAKRFNSKMRAENWNVLLLLDNGSSHRLERSPSNVILYMFSSSTSPYMQPQDGGIIRQFKAKISQLLNRYMIDRFNAQLAHVNDAGRGDME